MSLPVTARLRMRAFTPQDAETQFHLSREESLRKGIPNQVLDSPEAALELIQDLLVSFNRHETPYVLAVELIETGELIGHVGLSDIPEGFEIGFAIAEKYQRQGLAREAVTACTEFFGREFVLDALYGVARADNPASCRVLEACGYAFLYEEDRPENDAFPRVAVYRRDFPSYSRLIAERAWNQPDKGELESARERTYIDDVIQKSHLDRLIDEHCEGVRTAFDGGAGCGRFSIPLARRGVKVVHFDISDSMLSKARALAREAGVLDNITFVRGALEDLSAYRDGQFDLVLSFDAPVSYTYPRQREVIAQLRRICSKRLLLSVSSRLGYVPYLCNPWQKLPFLMDERPDDPWARWMLDHKQDSMESFRFDASEARRVLSTGLSGGADEIAEYDRGGVPWPITYLFTPDELRGILEDLGLTVTRMSGPGALARTMPGEALRKIMRDPAQREAFLDFCYEYDAQPSVLGLGKDNLVAAAECLP